MSRPASPTRPSLGAALKKASVGVTVAKALASGASPQVRGDPNNIKVGVRCRPLSSMETGIGEEVIVQFSGNQIN